MTEAHRPSTDEQNRRITLVSRMMEANRSGHCLE
jgi:hypothetical protein